MFLEYEERVSYLLHSPRYSFELMHNTWGNLKEARLADFARSLPFKNLQTGSKDTIRKHLTLNINPKMQRFHCLTSICFAVLKNRIKKK